MRPELWGRTLSIGDVEGVAWVIQLAVISAVDEVEFAYVRVVAADPQVKGDHLTSGRVHIAV